MTIESIKDFAAILNDHVAEMGPHYPGNKEWPVELPADEWRSLESAIADNRRALEAQQKRIAELEEALADLQTYVSMESYDQWLPEGHAKSSVLMRKLDAARAALRTGEAK
jgi:hypothetical protein